MTYDTAGNPIPEPTYCSCCRIDTAGNHEWNCPNNPRNKKKLWGLFKGLKIEEKDIEEAKKSLFPEREF